MLNNECMIMSLVKKYLIATAWVFSTLVVSSCVKEYQQPAGDGTTIIATATAPYADTKMIYIDNYEGKSNIASGWENGDTFLALEINGATVTPVTFTATASATVKATFKSSGAVQADQNTQWVAVMGKGARFEGESIVCSYAGQDGSIKGLQNVDFVTATSTGTEPDFNYTSGKHLSYVLRISMPEGVGKVEFNTAETEGEWTVDKTGAATPIKADYHPKAVKTLTLKSETTNGQVVYLAVPAINYSTAGLIVTAMNAAGTRSQGKVLSENFKSRGGHVGSYDLASFGLIDRPTLDDALNFISASAATLAPVNNTSYSAIVDRYDYKNCPRWAPFNLGASAKPVEAKDFYGQYFAWGETEQKSSYSDASYLFYGNETKLGYTRSKIGYEDHQLDLQTISGTKYDVARVKWGKEWRMPFLEEFLGLVGHNEVVTLSSGSTTTTNSGFVTTDVSSYNGISVGGRTFTRNGVTMFLPFAGKYSYTSSPATSAKELGKTGNYYCGTHNANSALGEAYRLYVRNTQVDNLAQTCGYGFSIRPVAAEETDIEPDPVKVTGRVYDKASGEGIANVNVSDGWSCCLTDASGNYTIEANLKARTINFTIPAAYQIPMDASSCPVFYEKVDLSKGAVTGLDFGLDKRASIPDKFTIVTLADAHVQTQAHLTSFKQGILADIQNTVTELESSGDAGEIIGMALGDQMWDNMSIGEDVHKSYLDITTSKGKVPFFYVIGNHDHEAYAGETEEDVTNKFVNIFGPTDYSFDIGNAHVVVMDDIIYSGTSTSGSGGYNTIKYREGITGEQLHWLKQDLANVLDKGSKLVILCLHAPIYLSPRNGENIKSQLNKFYQAHILSGHIHNMTNAYMKGFKGTGNRTMIEHNIQSAGALWWLADLSPNGTPVGYGVYTAKGSKIISSYNKVSKESKDFQIRVYSGNDVYGPSTPGDVTARYNKQYSWDSTYNNKFLVRIWDGDDPNAYDNELTWSVTFDYNGTSYPMTRLNESIVDKCAASFIVNCMGSPYGTGGTATSFSWWMIDSPGGADPASIKDWTVTATHQLPDGPKQTYSTSKLTNNYYGYSLTSNYIY